MNICLQIGTTIVQSSPKRLTQRLGVAVRIEAPSPNSVTAAQQSKEMCDQKSM